MPLDKGKLQKLYSTLQQGGYSQSYDEFEKGFTGNDNYPNRKKVYDLLTEHGADIGKTYEDFMGKMQAPSQPQQQNTTAPAPKPQPKPAPKPKPRPKSKGGGMTAAERAQFIRNAQGIVHQSAAGLQRVKNQMEYTKQKMKHRNVTKVHLGLGGGTKRTGGNSNVMVKHKDGTITEDNGYSPELNQALGNTYVTESGNEYDDPLGADFEQNVIDNQKTMIAQYNSERSVPGRLKSAYEMRDELEKKLEARRAELEQKRNERGTAANILQDLGNIVASDKMGGVNPYSDEMRGYENDPEYMSLMSSLRKVNSSIQTLETIKSGKNNSFWRGLSDTLSNGYTFNDGLPEMRDATAVINAQKHLPAINKKLQSGQPLTHEEQVAYDVLRANVFDNDVQGQYQDQLGAWYRAGSTTGTTIDFMKDFALTGGGAGSMTKGIYNGIVKKGTAALAKRGIEKGAKAAIAKGVLKATGIAAGTTAAGTMVSNTTGFGRVGAETGTNVAGQVGRDKNGNFTIEGQQSLLKGFANAERDMIGENQSEMFGEFIPGGGKYIKKGLEKIGLSKISGALTSIGNKEWYKQYSNLLKAGGWNGLPGEAMEEYEGMLFDALTGNGEQAWQQFKDPKTHIDIWLGCATTGALLGAVPTVVQAHHTAQYYRYKHATDSSDKVAAFRMTQAKWEPIKDIFDNTDNEHMADAVMDNVVNNKDLSQQEKVAALNYVRNLTKMRGYNIGTANNAGEEKDPEVEAQNEAYGNGYNTTDPAAMNDAKNRLTAAQQKFDEYMEKTGREHWEGEPSMQDIQHRHRDAQSILNGVWADGTPVYNENDEEYKLAQAVVNAQQEYEGMLQRVRDDIDDEVQQTGAIYDSRTNDNGVIQSATLKAQNPDGTDKKVYITSGNVVMTDDGKSVDKQKSDMSIVVVDEDGKVQMISPDDIFSLDTPIDGAQAKQQAIDAIQQSKAQEAADKINGKVNLTAGSTYTLTDNTGQQIEATIVADGQTGAVQNPDGTVNVSMNGKVVPMDVNTLQQMVDNTNMQKAEQGLDPRLVSRGTEQGAEDSTGQEQPTEQEGDQGILDQGGTVVPDDEGSGAVPTYPGSVVAPDMSEPHQWQVDDTFTIDNGGMPVRGQVTGVGADGVEIYTESPVNGKKMQVVSPEELQSMATEINGETVEAPEDEAAAEQQPTEPSPTEESGVNGVNGSNGVQMQTQEQAPQAQEQPQQTEGQPARAIDRIPSQQVDDGKGNVRTVHNWEQAEPGDTYDALTEIYHGNADRVKKGIDNRVGKIDKAIKGVQKKMDAIDNSDDFDEVAAQSEQYDQLQQQKDELEKQKKYWQGVSFVPRSRQMEADRRTEEEKAAAKAAQEKAEAEAAEKARQEREQVNGVPDVINDVPADARKRGFRNVNGMVVNRQGNTEGVTGRESNVKFSSTDTAKGHIKVIDADQLQPSHVSGQRNPAFFIDEAQPKDRTDTVSSMAAAKIASNLNPEEITGDGSAYQFSAPTVNSRGEVIQGNNRSDALKLMYSTPAFKPAQDAYKQYIADHAEEFGFTPEDVQKIQQMEHPVMVNELDVPDDEAIRLGQMRASDNESGGIERIDPVTTSQKLGGKVSNFANVLLSSPDEDASLSDVLMQNGAKAVKWLRTQGAISDTAAQSAFDKKGNLTPEARMDLQNILKQSLFQGGVSDLSTMFDKMPAKAQKAILSTFMRDFDSAEIERILPEIQKAIEAWYDCAMSNEAFAKASNYKAAKAAMHDWTLQTNLLDDNMPSDKFSNFAMELACRLQGCSMREAQQSLNDFFDLVQGKSQGDLFGGTTMGEQADRQESIRRIFNIEYKPISNNNGKTRSNAVADNSSQSGEGRQGSPADGKGRERAESGSGSADGAGGTESHNEEGIDKSAAALQQPTQPSGDSKHSIGATSSSEKKEAERQGVNTEPSEKQKEAGNYKKGHIKVDGYDISIENPKGSVREKKDENGKVLWRTPMHYDYGYILGTKGTDGDHIDVYLSDNPTSGNVYVVDQIDQKTGKFDEHKVMYGFPSKEAAVEAYKTQYEKGWKVGTVTEVSREDFKKWVESSRRKTKPFSEYKSVKDAAAKQPAELSSPTDTNGTDRSHWKNGADGKKLESVKDILDEIETRQNIAKYATMKADELRKREPDELRTLERKELAQADTNEQLAKIAKGEKQEKLLKDAKAHRANGELAGRIRQEVKAEREQLMEHRSNERKAQLTKREAALRDGVNELMREAGIEVIDDEKEGQRVLDMANGARLSKDKKRALETASPNLNGTDHQTVIPSADGAKVLKNLDTLVNDFENLSNSPKFFIGSLARALGAQKHGSNSEYATFETKNGRVVTIRLANHNAKVSTFDNHNESDGISIVITANNNAKLTNDAHVTEFYYNALKLRRAEGKPLADIVRSIKQALYSGEFKDTTGLAERQEVNVGEIARQQRVYHGSANDFDAFDTMNHLSEGEGSRAFGAGTYVADQRDLGVQYAEIADQNKRLQFELDGKITSTNNYSVNTPEYYAVDMLRRFGKEGAIARLEKSAENYRELSDKFIKIYKDAAELLKNDRIKLPKKNGGKFLYEVDIPKDDGKNYLDWDGELSRNQADTIRKRLYEAILALNDDYKGSEMYLAQDLSVIKEGGHIGDTYGTISDYLGSDKAASEFLHDLGYTGIKVHAAHNSNDARYKDNWNYVIFNDKDLKITDKVRFFRTANGEAYGFTVGGKIYIDPRIATSETPIHEYAHLWAEALRKVNPKEWANVVELMKGCKEVWKQVTKEYPELETDDEIAEEVLAHYSGKRGAERLRAEAAKAADGAKSDLEKDKVKSAFSRLKDAIKKAWKHIAEDILHIHFTTAEEVADKVMYDLLNKVNPNRFNLSKSVEEGKDLIAVHNLTEDKLKQSLELGGFPMPSIAITKSSMGHAEYGDISLLFGKDTINPSDSRNKVYSGDAWTPTFPHVSYKLDEKKLRDIYSRALKAGNLPFFDSARLHPENLKDRVDGNDSAKIIESGKKDYGMKQMFLSEKGNPVKGYVQKTVDKYSPERVELLQEILDKIGVEGLRNGKYEDELKQIVGSYRHVDLDSVKPFFAKLAMRSALRDAIDFAENGNKKVENDVEATQKEIDSRIAPKEYDQWLHDMLEGIIEKKGIRNNTDPYTRSGDRLKWERLYDAVTLDNVLKAMKAQPAKSEGFFNSIFGASAKELSNLNEVREEAKRRIKSVPEEEFKAEKDKILSRLEKISLPSVERSNSISGAMDFVENVKDAVVHSHTPRGIYKYLSDIYPDMTIDVANEIADVVKDIQSMSTRYLEAKPYRAVGFDEVRAAVVPSDTEAKIVQQLKDKGIPVYTYEKGNAEERRQVVNDAAQEQSVKFHKAEFGNSKKAAENEVEAVNKRFNEELEKYKRGEVPIGTRFELGMPSKALESAGFPYLPISMRASLLSKKAGMERHPFEASDLRDLVKAMQMPIAIFKYSKDNMRNLIVDVKHGDKHFLVGITLDYKAGDIEVNSVSGLFPKESHEWIKWIQDGKAIRIDQKKKVLDLIDSLRTNPAESERIGLNLSSVAKIVEDFENPVIKGENLSFEGEDGSIKDVPTTPEETEESDVLYRIADEDEAAKLDSEPTVKAYRAMQLIDGKLYPPMMAAVKGKLVEPRELGQWEVADERPDIITHTKMNKKGEEIGYVKLDKGSKTSLGKRGTPIPAAYNPYWHTSRSPLNDQFKSAWIRPNIVTVEVEIPESELTSGYRAKYAKDPVGETDWLSGVVTKQLTAQGHAPRKVILSRYDKPVRVLSAAETAERIIDYIGDYDVTIPENVVTPQVRVELEKRGIKIGAPEKGVKKTEQIREAIERGLSVSDDMLRDAEVFKDGETLPVSNRNRGYGVEGLNNDYRSLPELLEAFREKYPDYVATIVEGNSWPAIKVEPWRKYLSDYTGKRAVAMRQHTQRQQERAKEVVNDWARKLNLGDKVTVITDDSKLTGKKAKAKGWFDTKSGKITIVLPKHTSIDDVVRSILHEGVAHYGLRKMFGSHFDTFLDNVYAAADNDVRRRITNLAIRKYKGDFRVATEEYLASLAEQTDFEHIAETFWQKIKDFFLDMLHAIGFADFADKYDFTLSDNELRYILWRSYENLKEPGRYRSILGEAEDVAKQAELKVGGYSEAAAEPLQTERLTQKEREQKPNPAAMYGSARNSDYAAANDGVREPEAWGKRDMLSKAEQVSHGIDPDLLFRDTIEDDDNTARETYNRMADEAKSRIREAWQDSMINVRNLQQAVLEQRGEKLEDYEDAYNAENRSHGKSRAESEYFTDNLYKPLLKAVDDVAKAAKVSVGDVTEYMMAKHGLERNIVFARRDADAAYKKAYDEAKGKYDALMNASRAESDPKKADALEKAANKVKFPDYDDIFNYLRMRDYAGLTALTGQSDVLDAEAEAQRIVNDMESKALAAAQQRPTGPSNLIDELWKATNAATKWTLKKGYESGIISKDNYNYVSGMFNYYVPLRGWQEDTAGDLFDYVGSGDKGTAFSPTLHKAKGRRSEADNPIAYIGNMAVSAIVQGNKNKVKQTFLGFVENHPTNLVTVSEMWYRNFGTDTDPDWREDVPNIPEDATADEVADIVKQHEDMMEQLKDLGKATKKRGRLHLGVPVKKGQALEHHVEVMVNGKKYVLYINGNPRAAQALNGTRQRRASERSFESSKIAQMGRLLAERYTSLSPSFTVSNALRDLTMAAITTLIKESPAYAMRFRLNVLKLGGPARMFTLMKWYKKAAAQQQPTGQMSETQKYFYEFMTEGAETGFTSLKEIDEYKKDMDKMYRNMNQKLLNPKRLFRGLSQGLEYANRCIEDMTRFAIYMASRQSGRNVKRSVNDAKNITLNFNRKGSGEMGNATYRNLQIFVNPAIQSLQNVGKMAKDHPARFTLLTGSIALIGAAQVFATQLLWSVFGGGDGDDDDWNAVDEYWKLPSWQRRNNLVMWIPGTKKFAMIPLAQEFRVFHGFGETMTTVMEGKSGENPALEVLTQASDLLPLDFAGNNGNPLVNLAPTVTQPLLQVGFNTDFTGRPLYKDNDFNKYEPSFQKAYVGTPSWLIKSSEFINDITGGDDHMQGWWERTKVGKDLNNPAVVDHILKGYYGGMYSFLAQLGGTMYTLSTGNMPDAQEVPVVNRVITAPRETEQGGKQKLPDWYYDLSEENARQQNEFSGYKKDYMKGDADGQKKFNELINSKDFQKWQEVNTYIGAVQQIRTAMNYTKDPKEKAELEKSLTEVLGELKKMKDE